MTPFCLRNGGTQGEDNCVDNLAATARWSKTEEPEKQRFDPIIFIYYLKLFSQPLAQIFFISYLRDFFSVLGSMDEKNNKKTSENDQLTSSPEKTVKLVR